MTSQTAEGLSTVRQPATKAPSIWRDVPLDQWNDWHWQMRNRITTAEEMAHAVFENMADSDIIVKAAAVSDYRPKDRAEQKLKKEKNELVLSLERTQDILKEIGRNKKGQILVGFAAETEHLEQHAKQKLGEKNLDIIVGNIVGHPDSGFNADTNTVTLFYKDGTKENLPKMTKDDVANILLDRILKIL